MTGDELRTAYETMVFIRAFEERLNEMFLQGIVAGTTHLCIGQEACSVGMCHALREPDCLFSNHRGHGHLLARGAEPHRLMAEIFGQPHGFSGGRGGSQHIAVKAINFLGTHGITAGTMPLATGAALHKKRTGEPGVAVVFFGEGASGEGVFHESLNMAAIWKLPAIYVCENNLYAMSTSHEKYSPVPDVADRARAYGMHAEVVDGNDVEAVAEAAARARERATGADGEPVFLELKTFRQSGHSRGDACVYRTREEEAAWAARDPIARARAALTERHGWSDADDAAMQARVAAAVDDSAARAQQPEAAG